LEGFKKKRAKKIKKCQIRNRDKNVKWYARFCPFKCGCNNLLIKIIEKIKLKRYGQKESKIISGITWRWYL